jgi:hypothetical protein
VTAATTRPLTVCAVSPVRALTLMTCRATFPAGIVATAAAGVAASSHLALGPLQRVPGDPLATARSALAGRGQQRCVQPGCTVLSRETGRVLPCSQVQRVLLAGPARRARLGALPRSRREGRLTGPTNNAPGKVAAERDNDRLYERDAPARAVSSLRNDRDFHVGVGLDDGWRDAEVA